MLADTRGAYHLAVKADVLHHLDAHSILRADLPEPLRSAAATLSEPEIASAAGEARVQPVDKYFLHEVLVGQRADLRKIRRVDVLHADLLHKFALVLERDYILRPAEFRQRGVAVERKHRRFEPLLSQRRAYNADVSQVKPVKVTQRDGGLFLRAQAAVSYVYQIKSTIHTGYPVFLFRAELLD